MEKLKECKCGHDIRSHWNDCHTLNCPEDCMVDDCECKEFIERELILGIEGGKE